MTLHTVFFLTRGGNISAQSVPLLLWSKNFVTSHALSLSHVLVFIIVAKKFDYFRIQTSFQKKCGIGEMMKTNVIFRHTGAEFLRVFFVLYQKNILF